MLQLHKLLLTSNRPINWHQY